MIRRDGEGSLKTRAVTEGAMSAVIIVLLSCFNFTFGFVGPLIPIPLAMVVYRHGLKAGMAVSFVSAAVTSLILASPIIGLDLMIIGILGIAIGLAVKEGFSFTYIFIVGVGASVIASVLRLFTFSLIAGYSLIEEFAVLWEGVSQQVLEFWQAADMPTEIMAQYTELITNMPTLFQMLLPVSVLIYGIFETVICLLGLGIVFRRFGVSLPRIPRFIHWKLPWYFVWGFIACKAMAIILDYFPSHIVQVIVLNLDLFFSGAFFIQGLAIMWFFMTQAEISKVVRVLITAVALVTGNVLVYYILTMLGVMDTWFDIRKLNNAGKGGY